METWRLIESPPGRGDWNMAVDAALMESVAAGGACCLRFYTWSEPTVSLGYFQEYAARQTHPASAACPLVRRATGGGAIVHDRELTYSVVVPADHPLVSPPPELYQVLHRTLVAALAEWHICAALCDDSSHVPVAEEPFLCFQRRASGDVILGGAKIGGSAQRRRRGAILQHGSVLLARSLAAPELPGLAELGGKLIQAAELGQAWRAHLAHDGMIDWQSALLTESESQQASQIAHETYRGADWTFRR